MNQANPAQPLADILDLKPLADLPPEPLSALLPWLLAGAAALLALLAAWRIRRFLANRRPPAPAVDPVDAALAALEAQRPLLDQNRESAFALSDTLKRFLAARFGLPAPVMTGEEIALALDRLALSPETVRDLRDILRRTELAKFAGQDPGLQARQSDLDRTVALVRACAPREVEARPEHERLAGVLGRIRGVFARPKGPGRRVEQRRRPAHLEEDFIFSEGDPGHSGRPAPPEASACRNPSGAADGTAGPNRGGA